MLPLTEKLSKSTLQPFQDRKTALKVSEMILVKPKGSEGQYYSLYRGVAGVKRQRRCRRVQVMIDSMIEVS